MKQLAIDSGTGDLLPGRTRCSVAEFEQAFVHDPRFAGSSCRAALFGQWTDSVNLLRNVVGHVCAAWIGGSFLSAKLDPGDIDSVYVIEDATIDTSCASDPQRQRLLAAFAQNQLGALGWNIDSFILAWRVNAHPAPQSPDDASYLQNRGYWDDFWQRRRSGPKGATPVRADALPLRGYLEVILDGFPQ